MEKILDSEIKLWIVTPCYNEEGNVEAFYRNLYSVIAKYNYSILFVDDGSSDQTLSKIKAISLLDSRVRYISLSRNFGQQNALKAGYDYSTEADCVVSLDADLQHPPEIIDQLIRKWKDGCDIVNTIRHSNYRFPFTKRVAAWWFYRFVNYISKTKIIPNGPDFRLLDKKVINTICLINESNIYLKELIPWVGFKQGEIHFNVEKRQNGNSKYSFKNQLSTSLRGITSFSINPLRLSSLLGAFFSALSFLYCIYAVCIFFFTNDAVVGWTSLIASILFIAGIQFILIGIIGEYLGRTFLETRKRPLYIVAEGNAHPGNQFLNTFETRRTDVVS